MELDPRNVDALTDLATMLRVLRRYDEALEVLERERRLVPDDLQVLVDTGRCLLGLQRYSEAESVLRRALALNPYSAPALASAALAILTAPDLREVAGDLTISSDVRVQARRLLEVRDGEKE